MAGNFTVTGSNTEVSFKWTKSTAKMQSLITSAAHYLWDVGYGNHGTIESPILFSSLNNQGKLDIVDAHVRQVILDVARSYDINTAAIVTADIDLTL